MDSNERILIMARELPKFHFEILRRQLLYKDTANISIYWIKPSLTLLLLFLI